jgi:hypothetical protein
MLTRGVAPALVLAGACALAAAGGAAAGSPPAPPPAGAPSAASPTIPKGYKVVVSDTLAAPAGTQTRGHANCPSTLVPLSGGTSIDSKSTFANVNDSFPSPSGRGWIVDVNNASAADTTFFVAVVCADQPKRYAVVESSAIPNPAGTQTQASARCPLGSRPLSGGVAVSSRSLDVNVNTTIDAARGWLVRESNASGGDDAINAFVVCGRLAGYHVSHSTSVINPAGTATFSGTNCPLDSVAVGGGIASTSSSVHVSVNSSVVGGIVHDEWVGYESNATTADVAEHTDVVCAGAGS